VGKRQVKKTAGWSKLCIGAAVSTGVYLIGILLIAFLMVKGIIALEKVDVILAVWVMAAAFCGSLPMLKIKVAPPLLACLAQSVLFMILILSASYLFWEGPVWSRGNIALLLCALVGGLLPGVLWGRGGRKKKMRGW